MKAMANLISIAELRVDKEQRRVSCSVKYSYSCLQLAAGLMAAMVLLSIRHMTLLDQHSYLLLSDHQDAKPKPEAALFCWSSHHPPLNDDGAIRGLLVEGQGCSACTVGDICSFKITVAPPAAWKSKSKSTSLLSDAFDILWQKVLMVQIQGPALSHAVVSQQPMAPAGQKMGLVFVATYELWDPGWYTVSILAPCLNLNLGLNKSLPSNRPFAKWKMLVKELPQQQQQQPQAEMPPLPQMPPQQAESRGRLPCELGHVARWWQVDSKAADYRWTPFPCAPSFKPAVHFPLAVQRMGISHIVFVGDSHVRVMFQHILFILFNFTDKQHIGFHGDISHTITIPSNLSSSSSNGSSSSRNRTLTMSFFWIDGIFQNGRHGCKLRGKFSGRNDSFPSLPPSFDLLITDSAQWTFAKCEASEVEYAISLPPFFAWLTKEKLRAKLKRPPIFLGSPAWPGEGKFGCETRTNLNLQFANSLARALAPRHGFVFFDLWAISAPRFLDQLGGGHFSLVEEGGVKGVVGKAMSVTLLRFLTFNYFK